MLEELLVQYGALQRAAGYDPDEFLRPGASRDEIVDAWAAWDVAVPEEAIRLWQWHDGYTPGRYPGTALDSVEQSVQRYNSEELGYGDFLWNPNWIPVASMGGFVMNTRSEPPLVRGESGVRYGENWDQRVQVLSFCTVVAMGIYGREQGLFQLNDSGLPDTEASLWPRQLEITKLYGW